MRLTHLSRWSAPEEKDSSHGVLESAHWRYNVNTNSSGLQSHSSGLRHNTRPEPKQAAERTQVNAVSTGMKGATTAPPVVRSRRRRSRHTRHTTGQETHSNQTKSVCKRIAIAISPRYRDDIAFNQSGPLSRPPRFTLRKREFLWPLVTYPGSALAAVVVARRRHGGGGARGGGSDTFCRTPPSCAQVWMALYSLAFRPCKLTRAPPENRS